MTLVLLIFRLDLRSFEIISLRSLKIHEVISQHD
jgi:hypothetical protein